METNKPGTEALGDERERALFSELKDLCSANGRTGERATWAQSSNLTRLPEERDMQNSERHLGYLVNGHVPGPPGGWGFST